MNNLYWENLVDYARKNPSEKITKEKAFEILSANGQVIVDSWSVQDVYDFCKDRQLKKPSLEKAKEILARSVRIMDANEGLTWDSLQNSYYKLIGK